MIEERDRCIANIYALAKKKGVLIGDLEKFCGVSAGYLSRLRQDPKKPLPGSEFLFRAAARLEVSVDSLMYFDYQLANESDLYLHSFVCQVTADSVSGRIIWDPDPACFPAPVMTESKIVYPGHPLLSLDQEMVLQGNSREIYLSPFHPAVNSYVPLEAWCAMLSEDTRIHLTRVAPEGPARGELGESIELYLYNMEAKRLSPLCHTDKKHPGMLDGDLALLCETVSELLVRNPLDPMAVSAIDAYMNAHASKS